MSLQIAQIPYYTSSIIAHNTLVYEFNEFIKDQQTKFTLPFHKGLSFIAQVSKIQSEKVQYQEVSEYYESQNQTLPENYQELSWHKVVVFYEIEQEVKKKNVKIQQWRKNDIIKIISAESNETDSAASSWKPKDGIYFLKDFKKDIQDENSGKLNMYLEKLMNAYKKGTLFNFVIFYIATCLQEYVKRHLNLDLSMEQFLIFKDDQSIKFIFLPSFYQFMLEVVENSSRENANFNYKKFKLSYFLTDDSLNQAFKDKLIQCIQEFSATFLTVAELELLKKEQVFVNDVITKTSVQIEQLIDQQEQSKRFNQSLITNNQILSLLEKNVQNQEELSYLLDQEEKYLKTGRSDFPTQCQIINNFIQKYLPKWARNKKLKGGDTIFEFIPQIFNDKNRPLNPQMTYSAPGNTSASQTSSTTQIPQQSQKKLILNDNELKCIQAESDQKKQQISSAMQIEPSDTEIPMINAFGNNDPNSCRQLQISLIIKESQLPQQNLATNSQEIVQEKPQQQPQRGMLKKFNIEFNEVLCSLSMKMQFMSDIDLPVTHENNDETLYCLSRLNSKFGDIQVCLDDNKQIWFNCQTQMGQQYNILLELINMIDTTVSTAFIFLDFYQNFVLISKPSRDVLKYYSLLQEIQHQRKIYQSKYSEFVHKLQR